SRTSSGVSFPDSIKCVTIGNRLPPKERHEVVDHPVLCGRTRNQGFEDMGIADLARAAYGFFGFKTINHRLNCGVREPFLLWKRFHQVTDRRPPAPEYLHDSKFESGQFRSTHLKMQYCL